jgi:hypothetical protein
MQGVQPDISVTVYCGGLRDFVQQLGQKMHNKLQPLLGDLKQGFHRLLDGFIGLESLKTDARVTRQFRAEP